MNLLIDLQHPAHLHFFRNLILRLKNEGHQVLVTGRDKDILIELANSYGIEVCTFGVARSGLWNLGCELIYRQWRLMHIVRKFRPDMIMAIAGTFVSLVGRLSRVPTYVFYDTEHATISNMLAYPFATCIYVPRCYQRDIRWRHQRYNGYHELAYLHPNYFTPDPSALSEAGLGENEKFTLVRFVAWGAGHDIGKKGLSLEQKTRIVESLSKHSRVLISAEGELPPQFMNMRLNLDVSRIHDLMAYASLIMGESATMPSEGAVMGVPGVYINPLRLGYLEEQEHDYGLIHNFTPSQCEAALATALDILTKDRNGYWRERGQQLIADKVDVTDMLYSIATT